MSAPSGDRGSDNGPSGDQQQLSDADKIRLKRLARLGTPSTPSAQAPTSTAPSNEPSSEQESSSSIQLEPPRQPSASSSRLLSSPLPSAPQPSAPSPSPAARSATPGAKSSSLGKRPIPAISPKPESVGPRVVSTPQASRPLVPYTQWETEKVSAVFSVTLDRGTAESTDWRLCWLKDLAGELRSESHPLKTTLDLADRLLIARLSLDPATMAQSDDPDILTILAGLPTGETVFEYLTGAWKRLYAANREQNRLAFSPSEKSSWTASFEKLRSLIISYCGMTLEDPSMFPQPSDKPTGPAEFLPLLLSLTPTTSPSGDLLTSTASTPSVRGPLLPDEVLPFIGDLGANFDRDTLADVITPTLSLFFQEWFKLSPTPDIMGNEWRRYLGAVATLVQVKQIAALLPSLPVWVAPEVTAPRVEWQSLLGPLTRLSVYPREFAEIWKTYFSNPTERKVADIDANKDNLRHTIGSLHTSLFNIYNAIVRASPESREGTLDFFALVIRLNEKRAGMRVDPRTVSSDGFMTNLQVVLLKLFEPVMDITFSKIDKVDPEYFRTSKRVNITDETKIKATKEEADDYYGSAMEVDKPANFISDLFFLLNAFQHLGLVKTIGNRGRAEKNISEIEKELKRAEASRADWNTPALQAQGDAAIKKLKSDIATLHASCHAYDTQLLDKSLVRLNVSYLGFLMTWLVRLVDPKHLHPATTVSLPLPAETPQTFRMLPEYLFDNVAEYFDFLARYDPDALDDADKDTLITFIITFLSPDYVNNPFLKAKLVTILSYGLWPMGYWRKGALYDRLSVHNLSTQYLMPTLIRFFIDVEMTGGHTQFWDKFNFRRDVSRIFKSMWANPLHREAFEQSRRDDFDQFIKFINMLMSDTTFHLEESLTSLAKINSLSAQMNQDSFASLPQAERDDTASQLRQSEGQAPFHTQMGLDHVELIRDFTATTREPFVTPEIVDRLAAALDQNLVLLVGSKMQELKVADPDKFSFKPKRLLAAIAQIYLNLSEETDFIRAVANDGRSYSKELFERFARVLKHRAIMTEAEVGEVVSFAQKVEDMRATIEIEDEREIPDEFLDPLLSTLMRDPVTLPVSRVVIDRSTIRTHLLSKEVDPFNNVPLKLEDVIPNPELKVQIEAWVAEGKIGRTTVDVDM